MENNKHEPNLNNLNSTKINEVDMIYMFEIYDILRHADEVESMILLSIFL